jgi:hypothetical protein
MRLLEPRATLLNNANLYRLAELILARRLRRQTMDKLKK